MRLFFLLFFCACLTACMRTPETSVEDLSGSALSDTSLGGESSGANLSQSGAPIASLEGTLDQAALRRRFRGLIHRADYYALKNEEEAALKQYTSIYQKLGRDPVIMKKIGTLSFQLKNWSGAYEFLRDLPFEKLSTQERQMYLNAVLSKSATYEEKAGDLARTPLSDANRPYWNIALVCTEKPQECVTEIESYSGTEVRSAKLKEIIANFATISPDPSYRDALLAGTFFAHKQYAPAYALSREIITKRPKYFAVLKIGGISAYELGNIAAAKELLEAAYTLNGNEKEVAYTLGIIASEAGDPELSNIYLNVAVLNGYRPKTDLERRLVYNYFLLGDSAGVMKVLRYLVDEEDARVDDFSIAVYSAIQNEDLSSAVRWGKKGLAKYPESDMLLALFGWALRLEGKTEDAETVLRRARTANANNPVALYHLGLILKERSEYTNARILFADVVKLDTTGLFVADAEEALKTLDLLESAYGTGGSESGFSGASR